MTPRGKGLFNERTSSNLYATNSGKLNVGDIIRASTKQPLLTLYMKQPDRKLANFRHLS